MKKLLVFIFLGFGLSYGRAVSIFEAVKKDDLFSVAQYVAQGGNINARDKNLRTPLFYALDPKSKKTYSYLLKNGADVNLFDNRGYTPLMQALILTNISAVKTLLFQGASATIIAKDGGTALHKAALLGRLDIVRLLMKKGADSTLSDTNGNTVLMDAVRGGSEKLVWFLMLNGADPRIRDNFGKSALQYAEELNQTNIAVFVEEGLAFYDDFPEGVTGLMIAVRKGSLKQIKDLLNQDSSQLKKKDSLGLTALHYATGRPEVFAYLIEKGMNIRSVGKNGRTVLMSAAGEGSLPIVKFLVTGRVSLKAVDERKDDALSYALTGKGELDLISYLVDEGLSVHKKYEGKVSTLMMAATRGKADVVEYLISKGVNINSEDDEGNTALFFAQEYEKFAVNKRNYTKIITLLESMGAK